MRATTGVRKQPDLLMSGLVCVSIVIHIFVYLHISGIYRSRAIQHIEFALANLSKPVGRAIPRPRMRPKVSEQPHDIKRIIATPRPVPQIRPFRMTPLTDRFSDGVMEGISLPSIDAGAQAGGEIVALDTIQTEAPTYTTARNYLEMIMLKIETGKRYPDTAKSMRKEGRVKVAFTVTQAGLARDVRILKPCRHEVLNQAALKAVRDAAPFPRPPVTFFKNNIPLQLTIIFEIT